MYIVRYGKLYISDIVYFGCFFKYFPKDPLLIDKEFCISDIVHFGCFFKYYPKDLLLIDKGLHLYVICSFLIFRCVMV